MLLLFGYWWYLTNCNIARNITMMLKYSEEDWDFLFTSRALPKYWEWTMIDECLVNDFSYAPSVHTNFTSILASKTCKCPFPWHSQLSPSRGQQWIYDQNYKLGIRCSYTVAGFLSKMQCMANILMQCMTAGPAKFCLFFISQTQPYA